MTGLPLTSRFDESLTVGLRLYEQDARAVLTLPPFPLFRMAQERCSSNHSTI